MVLRATPIPFHAQRLSSSKAPGSSLVLPVDSIERLFVPEHLFEPAGVRATPSTRSGVPTRPPPGSAGSA